jgi:hypothetical protein
MRIGLRVSTSLEEPLSDRANMHANMQASMSTCRHAGRYASQHETRARVHSHVLAYMRDVLACMPLGRRHERYSFDLTDHTAESILVVAYLPAVRP